VASLSLNAPAAATAGSAISITVTALDPYGNVATGYTGTVHFTSSDGRAVVPADYAFTASDAGSHTFTAGATLETAGSQTVGATDAASSSVSGTGSEVAVGAAAASQLAVTTPASATAGTGFAVTVTALDPYGNVATGHTGTVRLTSTDPAAVPHQVRNPSPAVS
jgi:hypothetical protein